MQRRSFLRAGLLWGGAGALGAWGPLVEQLAAESCDGRPIGDLLDTLPLHGDRARRTPFGEMLGGPGLDARRFTDLSQLDHGRTITPTAEMFVRTAAPVAWRTSPPPGSIATIGFATQASGGLTAERLRQDAQPMGAHLIECAGNADPDNFGLMSVTEWEGVPLARIVSALGRRDNAWGVLVSGADDTAQQSRSSSPGASWVFPLEGLQQLGAFLAVRMNGEPLTPDHGAPVRLVVPGWYGCSWIKWVDELRLVGQDEPATSQMLEFARRTHQRALHPLARDYDPPAIDLAATPIRVEKRRVSGRVEYRVVGIVWGGERPVDRLAIRFTAGENPAPFRLCPAPRTHRTWSLWDYRWRPSSPGAYAIALTGTDASIRTRRLDLSYYVRRVVIAEV
jgi:DMSO/TMAO reductase YedYZ molybdopterin-dependent catalytic subunit